MKPLIFTIIKLTDYLVLCILLGYFFSIAPIVIFLVIAVLFTGLLIAFIIAKKQFLKTVWFGVFAYLLMIFIGVLTTYSHNEKNFENHYSNHFPYENDSLNTITFKVREVLKPSAYYDKYVITILKIGQKNVTGKALLNIQKDTI